MVNSKIIYIAVVLVFFFILCKLKVVPYLAARKILKDAKKNGKSGNGTAGAETSPTAAQPSYGGFVSSVVSPDQLVAAMQSAFPVGMVTAPSPGNVMRPREMFFDYETVDTRPEDSGDADVPSDPVSECELLGGRVNALLFRLRNRGIVPDTLGILPIADGVFMAYVIYTV